MDTSEKYSTNMNKDVLAKLRDYTQASDSTSPLSCPKRSPSTSRELRFLNRENRSVEEGERGGVAHHNSHRRECCHGPWKLNAPFGYGDVVQGELGHECAKGR
jgi:hypothetical protein